MIKSTDFGEGAILNRASLIEVDLAGANLSGADLSEAVLSGVRITNVDLSETKGLDTVIHSGPSSIGIDTIYKSKGQIPDIFLRGCGVPDNFITYMHSLTGSAIEFYSCFISYSRKDEDFATRLHADLQQEGVRCWFAPEDIQGGKKLFDQIEQAIRLHEKLLLVLSENSINSKWVKREIRRARKAEIKEGSRKLFPISLVKHQTLQEWEDLNADTGEDLAESPPPQ